jgi:alkylation response protein AidB-like acyl-CoA dehydrogenase
MDVDLSGEQELLRETTARFIEARCPMTQVRARAEEARPDPDLVHAAGELGWYALFVPEEFGGGSVSGSSLCDAVIVAEERGRLVQPGPFVGPNVVAFALAAAGRGEQQEEWLPRLAAGDATATWAISDRSGAPEAGAISTHPARGSCSISGTAGLVPEAATADLFLVTAVRNRDETVQFLVPAGRPGVEVRPTTGLDLTRNLADVRFNDVLVTEDDVLDGGDPTQVQHQVDVAVTLTIAETVGTMRRLMEMTLEYAKQRTAFGRPIGSFQALKHLLADVSLWLEVSMAGASAATQAVAGGRSSASEIASIAKAYIGDAGVAVAQACQQAHGGIGFTWEHDLHFYLRRLATDRVLYGDPRWHRERICRIHDL